MTNQKKKLTKKQQRVWARLTGEHNLQIREQIEYMRQHGTITRGRAQELTEQSYTATASQIWHSIIGDIRRHVSQHISLNPPRRKPTHKGRSKR